MYAKPGSGLGRVREQAARQAEREARERAARERVAYWGAWRMERVARASVPACERSTAQRVR